MSNIVIIPTYRERENIEAIINAISELPIKFDILIIDDNSPDGTADLVKSLQSIRTNLHLIERSGKLGLGTAYITGFKWALDKKYDYIFEMDADFSHNPADLIRLFNCCHIEGADLAIGSRYISGVNVVNHCRFQMLQKGSSRKYKTRAYQVARIWIPDRNEIRNMETWI
jgi:dolichol-phosphate mannosyltransferase